MLRLVAVAVVLILCQSSTSHDYFDHYINEFVAEIDGDNFVAELVAGSHDLQLLKKVDLLGPNVFHFISGSTPGRSKRSSESLLERLRRDSNVLQVEQMKLLERHKRPPLDRDGKEIIYDKQTELERPQVDQEVILERYFGSSRKRGQRCTQEENREIGKMKFDDPLFCLQWYLNNDGSTKGKPGYDVHASEVWKRNITGRGVVVTVLDDGLDHKHPDLKENYDPEASYDLNSRDDVDHDPAPEGNNYANAHGTRCAGEIAAAANNGVCGVGIAYHSRIGGIRMLDGNVTDSLEAQALSFKRDYVQIYSASWGPRDDGRTLEGPGHYASRALKEGAEQGRNGLGSIFAWATGNGGEKDDCSCDGYVGSIYTISIGCVNSDGLSTYFSEICPSTMAVIFTGGSHAPPGKSGYNHPDISIITTDINNGCDVDFEGTSSAAPLAAGVFALVLEVNPGLGWRDMQHLLTMTAHIPNGLEDGWTINGGGFHVNPKFGFGVMDAEMMVLGALEWITVPEQKVCEVPEDNDEEELPVGGNIQQMLHSDGCGGEIQYVEHLQVHITMTTRRRGDLSIKIKSPGGTVSEILSNRPRDDYKGSVIWTFMTVHNWGENPTGDWELTIQDLGSEQEGTSLLQSWSMTIYGTTTNNPNNVQRRQPGDQIPKERGGETGESVNKEPLQEAHVVSQSEVQAIMDSEMSREEESLQEKVDASRQRLAELDNLASKVLSGEDYALYRKYVLGEDGQKELEQEKNKYSDNWWKRMLDRPSAGNGPVSDNRERRLEQAYKRGYVSSERGDEEGQERAERIRMKEGLSDSDLYNGMRDYRGQGDSNKRTSSDLTGRERQKIDEIIELIDEMLAVDVDES